MCVSFEDKQVTLHRRNRQQLYAAKTVQNLTLYCLEHTKVHELPKF